MNDKRKAIEIANYHLKQGGLEAYLTELHREGVAIVIPDVTFEDLGYNVGDNKILKSSSEVKHVVSN